jgi:hypothetical protein
MTKIEGICRDVCEATEFVTIVTTGDDGPHVVGNWGDYMRVLGIKENMIIFPAGATIRRRKIFAGITGYSCSSLPKRCKELAARVKGASSSVPARFSVRATSVDAVKAKFPWARGAMVIHVEDVKTQL